MATSSSESRLTDTTTAPQRIGVSRYLPLVIAVAIPLLTILVFLPVRGFEYVNYDDGDYVMSNREVQRGLTYDGVIWAFTTGHAANWHPLTWLSHMLDFQLFGNDPGRQHLTNLFFHTANAGLLFLLMRRLTRTLWRSAFVAAIFALHPVHVESVAWLSERKDVLSGLFWILTMFFYASYAQKRNSPTPTGISDYALSLICFALGLMSKPMLVTLPCVLLLIDLWPLQRVEKNDTGYPSFTERKNWLLLLEKLPFLLLALSSSVITFFVQKKGGAVASMDSLSFAARFSNALVSYWRYARKMIWPDDLAVLYPHPGEWQAWRVALAALFLIAVLVLALWQMRRRPYIFVGSLWFFGTMIPVIGLVQVGIQSMADRYTYIPSIGFSIALTWAVVEFVNGFKGARYILATVGMALVVACIPVTHAQIGYWANSDVLFRRTILVTKDNYLAWNNLGFSLPKSRSAEAMECYRQSIKINPVYVDALNNLGHALAEQGHIAQALPLYEVALKQQPKHADVNNNYGNALAEIGKVDQAVHYYLIALATNPNHADAHNNLGIALAMQGHFDDAMIHLHRAIELDPGKASAHSNLGNAYAVQHKLEEATAQYLEALRLKPDEAQVHNNLGNVLSEQQRFGEAIQHYEMALQLNPRNPEAHYNVGLAFLHEGKRDDALLHFKQALQQRPDYSEVKRQLSLLNP